MSGQFCEYCGGDYSDSLPCVCQTFIDDNYKRKDSPMIKIKARLSQIEQENHIVESIHTIIEEQCSYIHKRELLNLTGVNNKYAFGSLERTMHVLNSIADEIAHSRLSVRLVYGYRIQMFRSVAISLMQDYNTKLESYVKGIALCDISKALLDATKKLLAYQSDDYLDCVETWDGYFLTPRAIVKRNATQLVKTVESKVKGK